MELHGISWTSVKPLKNLVRPPPTPVSPTRINELQESTSIPPVPKRSITSLPTRQIAPRLGRRQSMDLFECIETVPYLHSL
jgi:hypothetical protein